MLEDTKPTHPQESVPIEGRRGAEAAPASVAAGSFNHGTPRLSPSVPEPSEAWRELCSIVHTGLGALPSATVASHVLSITPDTDWPVQRAALSALMRRWTAACRDELRVSHKPSGGAMLGAYRTRPKGGDERPYTTVLRSIDPPITSCDCKDHQRGSLGWCKHGLTILNHVFAKPGRIARARREQRARECEPVVSLSWDPVRPFVGSGDWFERLRLENAGPGTSAAGARLWRLIATKARRCFDREGRFRLTSDSTRELRKRRMNELAVLIDILDEEAPASHPVDPAVRALLNREQGELEMQHAGRERRRVLGALRSLKQGLYPYQREGVERFLASGRLLLADDMGLGKTAQAISAGHALFVSGTIARGLIVVPASLKSQWRREWQLFSDVPISVVDGTPEQRREFYAHTDSGFLIVNYEQLWRDLPFMQAWEPGLVILDEAQRIKNWATKTASQVSRLKPQFRLALTGTPIENRLGELAALLDWVDDHALAPEWRLEPWHTWRQDGEREVLGARHLDTLRERIAPRVMRRVRSDVLKQLPARRDTPIRVPLTDSQRDAHDALTPRIVRLIAESRKRPLTQGEFLRLMMLLTRQRIICNGLAQMDFEDLWPSISRRSPNEALLNSLATPKLAELRELVQGLVLDQGGKVVVFSQWKRMLQLAEWATRPLLEQAGKRAAFFTGAESQKRRTQNVIEFHDDDKTAVLFATDAGGVGLNLQRAAHCCINLDLPWNPAVLEQRIGRVYRLGQTEPVQVYNLLSDDGIESRIAEIVNNKQVLFTGLFDGSSDSVRFDGASSFLAQMESAFELEVSRATSSDAMELEEDDALSAGDQDPGDEVSDSLGTELQAKESPPRSEGTVPAEREPVVKGARAEEHTPPPRLGADDIREALSRLRVEVRDDGVAIHAPREAAATLAQVFGTLAQQLGGM